MVSQSGFVGKFVDALKKLIAPEDLISKSFKTVVVYPVKDDIKDFEDIAQALDYAFDKGYRNKRNWLIINDKNKTVLSDRSIPNTLQGIIEGLYGVPFDGLGKPTIKLEFEDNAQLADFLKDNQPHYQYAQYTDVTASETSPNTATDAKAKARSNGKLMPAADSRTFPEPPTASALPPTKTPPPLPQAPTAKALPEHKGHQIGVVLNPLNVTPVKYTFADGTDTTLYKADDGTLYTKFPLYDDLPYLEDFSYDEQTKILTLKWKYLILISGIKFYPTEYPEINYTFVCPAYNVEFLARNKWRKIMTANVPYVDYIKYFYDRKKASAKKEEKSKQTTCF